MKFFFRFASPILLLFAPALFGKQSLHNILPVSFPSSYVGFEDAKAASVRTVSGGFVCDERVKKGNSILYWIASNVGIVRKVSVPLIKAVPVGTTINFSSLSEKRFVDRFGSSPKSYRMFGPFFYRKLKRKVKIQKKLSGRVFSTADSRLTVLSTTPDLLFAVKRKLMKASEIFCGSISGSDEMDFLIFRLAPTDYHSFHAPFPMQVLNVRKCNGSTLSVNPVIEEVLYALSENRKWILETRRTDTNEIIPISVVAATMVGQVEFADGVTSGKIFEAGAYLGKFKLSSSTLVIPLRRGSVRKEILEISLSRNEAYVEVGTPVSEEE